MAVRALLGTQAHSAILLQANAYPTLQSTGRRTIAFSDASDWSCTDGGVMPAGYAGGSITVVFFWASWTVTTGNCRWTIEFERMAQNGNATTANTFGTLVPVAQAPSTTLAAMQYCTFTLSAANMGSIVAGESFRFRIGRTGSNVADTMVGLAYYYGSYFQEI